MHVCACVCVCVFPGRYDKARGPAVGARERVLAQYGRASLALSRGAADDGRVALTRTLTLILTLALTLALTLTLKL